MPFAIRKRGSKHVVVNADTGDVKGTHDDPEKAKRQLAALKANVREGTVVDALVPLREVETFSKPGTADVTPSDLKKLGPLMKHYAAMAHPFTVCKRDQMKHGLPEDHANRRCAVLKDLIRGTTKWRNREEELTAVLIAAGSNLAEAIEEIGEDLAVGLGSATPVEEIWKPADLVEREFSAQARKTAAKKGAALPDGSYPIHNAGDLRNAVRAVGRAGKGKVSRVKSHIRKRAKALGLTKLLPDSWGGAVTESIAANLDGLVESIAFDAETIDSVLREAVGRVYCPRCEHAQAPGSSQCEGCGASMVKATKEAPKNLSEATYPNLPIPKYAMPSSKAMKATAAIRAKNVAAANASSSSSSSSSSSNSNFNQLHPRGAKGTSTGGKFVQKGSTGTGVKKIQRTLGVKPTGTFNHKTFKAVETYQKNHGLQVDGVVGRQTFGALTGRSGLTPGALTPRDRRLLTGSKALAKA